MEPKLNEIIQLVKESTNDNIIEWKLTGTGNQKVIQSKIGNSEMRLINSGSNVSFQLRDEKGIIASIGEPIGQSSLLNLKDLWDSAYRQSKQIDLKLDNVINELKNLKRK